MSVHEIALSPQMFNRPIVKTKIAVIHPLFYSKAWPCVPFDEMMSCMNKYHRIIVGFEVADSTRISQDLIAWANHRNLNAIFVPSLASKKAFESSGVTNKVMVLPHGSDLPTASDRFSYLNQKDKPVVLSFFITNMYRKGADQFKRLIAATPECYFVIKTDKPDFFRELAHLSNLDIISDWLREEDVASLYQNSDIYCSCHRGGAFELNCLESLLSGCLVLAPRFGAVLDYLNDQNAFLLDIKNMDFIPSYQNPHWGDYPNINIESTIQTLKDINLNLENYKSNKTQKLNASVEKYSWTSIGKQLLHMLESLLNE